MNTPEPALLRKAIKITMEIEQLDHELHRLLMAARSGAADVALPKKPSLQEINHEAAVRSSKKAAKKAVSTKEPIAEKTIPAASKSDIVVEETPSLPVTEVSPMEDASLFVLPEKADASEPTHHEQQALLMEDSGQEPLALIEVDKVEVESEQATPYIETISQIKEERSSSSFFF